MRRFRRWIAYKLSRLLWFMETHPFPHYLKIYGYVFCCAERCYPYPKGYISDEPVGFNAFELEMEWRGIEDPYTEFDGALVLHNKEELK